ISEASGAWESGSGYVPGTGQQIAEVTDLVDQATFQKDFWSPIISSDFLDTYPLVEAVYIFDIIKQEEFMTDFRVSYDPSVRGNFTALVDALDAQGRLKWATAFQFTSTTTTTSSSLPSPTAITSTAATKSSAFPAMKSISFIFGLLIFLVL
ncbi:hypothetical protein HK100_009402, partial [Physocladia obscura]